MKNTTFCFSLMATNFLLLWPHTWVSVRVVHLVVPNHLSNLTSHCSLTGTSARLGGGLLPVPCPYHAHFPILIASMKFPLTETLPFPQSIKNPAQTWRTSSFSYFHETSFVSSNPLINFLVNDSIQCLAHAIQPLIMLLSQGPWFVVRETISARLNQWKL